MIARCGRSRSFLPSMLFFLAWIKCHACLSALSFELNLRAAWSSPLRHPRCALVHMYVHVFIIVTQTTMRDNNIFNDMILWKRTKKSTIFDQSILKDDQFMFKYFTKINMFEALIKRNAFIIYRKISL